jgi:hypothetical protein
MRASVGDDERINATSSASSLARDKKIAPPQLGVMIRIEMVRNVGIVLAWNF